MSNELDPVTHIVAKRSKKKILALFTTFFNQVAWLKLKSSINRTRLLNESTLNNHVNLTNE